MYIDDIHTPHSICKGAALPHVDLEQLKFFDLITCRYNIAVYPPIVVYMMSDSTTCLQPRPWILWELFISHKDTAVALKKVSSLAHTKCSATHCWLMHIVMNICKSLFSCNLDAISLCDSTVWYCLEWNISDHVFYCDIYMLPLIGVNLLLK